MEDEFLNKAIQTLKGNEHKILDEFVMAFLAHQSLQGLQPEEVFSKYRLCIEHITSGVNVATKYYLEQIEKEHD